MKIDATTLSGLDKKALLALLVEALAQEPATTTEPEVTTCGFPTLKGTPCSFTAKQDGRCGKHIGKTEQDVEASRTKAEKFHEEVIVGKREQRKARKTDNKALAAALRAEGKVPNGDVWQAAKHLVEQDGLSLEEAATLA